MRVCVVHNFYQQAGGEDQIFFAEAELLRSRGHWVASYSIHNDAVKGMNPLSLAARTVWNRPRFKELFKLFERHRPDVVHSHNTFPLVSPAIYYAARMAGAAVVQSLHNFRLSCPNAFFYREGSVCEKCRGKRFAWPAVRYGCYRNNRAATAVSAACTALHRAAGTYEKRIDRYIANTEFGARKFAECGLPAARIRVKPNFLADDPGPGHASGGYALFVGRLSPEKGIDLLLEAFRREKRIPLKVAGTGPEEPKVAAAASQCPHISHLGKQPREEILRLMKEAAFLVFPSRWYEGFPMTIVEAYACGLPVIAGNLGCMSSLISHGKTGLHFRPGDTFDLARQIRWALEHPQELREMGRAARREFQEQYTPGPNYATLLRIYQEAIEERNRALQRV